MVLVFDLDDTLYDELTYVQSGFGAVSDFLFLDSQIPLESSYQFMVDRLASGRGTIFDELLTTYGIYTQKRVRQCLAVYRRHQPDIRLDKAAVDCLERFLNFPKYIVTDGNKLVQANKIKALGLGEKMNGCYITHCYGIKNAKPSPYCFLKICEREKVEPQAVVYIADNPRKDFINLKPLGFKTVRIMQGAHREVELASEYEADVRIGSLAELTTDFIRGVITGIHKISPRV